MSDKSDYGKMIKFWIESSDKNFQTAEHLLKSKDYDWTLFMCHLVIEKLLKALFVKNKMQNPPLIHNLLRLTELCEIESDDESLEFLATVTTFNINARYDDYKETFSKQCTKDFTEFWFKKIKEYREWIKSTHLM